MKRGKKVLGPATVEPPLTISDQQWKSIEKAYGRVLSEEVRFKIGEATKSYMILAMSEATGLPLKSVVTEIDRIGKLAEVFLRKRLGDNWRNDGPDPWGVPTVIRNSGSDLISPYRSSAQLRSRRLLGVLPVL